MRSVAGRGVQDADVRPVSTSGLSFEKTNVIVCVLMCMTDFQGATDGLYKTFAESVLYA